MNRTANPTEDILRRPFIVFWVALSVFIKTDVLHEVNRKIHIYKYYTLTKDSFHMSKFADGNL